MLEYIAATGNFVLGTLTVLLSAYACYRFRIFSRMLSGHADDLSRAISYQLLGEAVIGMGTLIFAMAAWAGVLSSWPELLQSAIRFIMFIATSVTTLHLVRTIERHE